MERNKILLTPIHEHIVEKNSVFLHVTFFLVLVLLTAGFAYQAVELDRQLAAEARI